MPGARCVILYSEVVGGEPGTPEYALCLKQTIKHPAVLEELGLLPDTLQRVEEIGLRGEFTMREQAFLKGVLLSIAGLANDAADDAA